jgi:hypothetical protein
MTHIQARLSSAPKLFMTNDLNENGGVVQNGVGRFLLLFRRKNFEHPLDTVMHRVEAAQEAVGCVLEAGFGLVRVRRVSICESIEMALQGRVAVVKRAEIVGSEDRHVYFAGAGSTGGTGSFSKRISMRGLPGVA